MNINKRLLHYVKTMRVYVMAVGLLGLLTALCIVLQSHYIAQIINGAFLARQPLARLISALSILLLVLLGRAGLVWGGEVVTNFVSGTVKSELRLRLFRHIFQLGPLYVKGERSGEIVNTAVGGVEALDAYFNQFFPQACATLIIPTVILAVVFATDTLSGIVLLVTWPILPLFMILIGKQASAMTERRWQLLSHLSAHFLDVLQGMTTLKLFGRNKVQQETIQRISERYGATTMKVLRVAFLSSFVMEMGATISNAIIAVEIGLRLLYGNIPFEQAFFVLLLTPEFYQPLRALGAQFHASMESAAGAQRIFDVLEIPTREQALSTKERPARTVPGSLRFHDVHYAYPTADDKSYPALQGVSFEMRPGQKVALVGPSGAGKSTIASLLLRFIEPDRGDIAIDGVPIQAFSAQDWRALVGWQPQRPYLFNATVAENIRLGNPTATLEQVVQAARQANIHDFIETLPAGYATVIGERGARLSGGQAQRLSLARVFLKDAPLLVLDEATSTLDAEGEAEVLRAIDTSARDRIVLVIAHRLNTIMSADQIIVLQDGRVVDRGSHQELLARAPLYQELVAAYEDDTLYAGEEARI
ncbi:MAG: thiol reductant ABC exporter subunit CydD [Ktedonobacteraceae bacterium]